ncbi:hypothetical protein JVU11DRAFT_4007 [Chiua virens]|nr:hypothetical protein JVU11DRAFT_4007 [Chiua virens]
MLRAGLLCFVASALRLASALGQVPLGFSPLWHDEQSAIFGGNDPAEWDLHKLPHPHATDHLVFETVRSLLQNWPNTRMRNGHTLVPGIIPPGTIMYFATMQNEVPDGAEWLAMDPEHSYFFCRERFPEPPRPELGCWFHTLSVTQPIKVLYLDGTSAAKIPFGPLDTQDMFLWGEARPDKLWDEWGRLELVCDWAKRIGVDGIIRMEMSFELMLCDFSSHVTVISGSHLVHPGTTEQILKGPSGSEVTHAGSWHNYFPGETRIQLDLSGLVSFYDTQLVPSLVPIRAGQERWDHRVANLSRDDLLAVESTLKNNLAKPVGLSSGIDWQSVMRVVADRFVDRLELTRYLLSLPASNPDEIVDLANKAQVQLRVMLNHYLHIDAFPTDLSDETVLDWAIPIYTRCTTPFTKPMEALLGSMTDSEKLILRAIRGTNREICRVFNTKESPDISKLTLLRKTWAEDLNRLVKWLDWNEWVKCDPACGPEEMCWLPTWPIGFPLFERPPIPLPIPVRDGWKRPEPKCIRLVDPYEF